MSSPTDDATTPHGLAVVDKPAGWTSHDVVAKARGVIGTKKIGHAGTLDPDATGVLLLGVGKATRLLRFLSVLPKSYIGEVVLGTETTTLDDSGDVTATHDMSGVTIDDVRAAAAQFVGAIEQVPPMVSAVQVEGRRLHDLARQGIEVERKARPVTVHRFEVIPTADSLVFGIDVQCSSGTYIRTLAADLGHALGGGAHLRRLRRTAVGPHSLAEARPLDDVDLQPVAATVAHLPHHVVTGPEHRRLVATGSRVPDVPEEGAVALVDEAGDLLAVFENGRPSVVLIQPEALGRQ